MMDSNPPGVDPSELGYVFYPFPDGSSLGYSQLDVFLSDHTTAAGFVPSHIVVCTWDGSGGSQLGSGGVSKTTISSNAVGPAGGEATRWLAPGFITVYGHGGGELEAYSFGGSLAYRQHGDGVICRITSPAPILNLSEEGLDSSENSILRVVDRLESEIATMRTQFATATEATFDQQLASTDARLLYAVALDLAHRSFHALPEALRTERYWDEYGIINRALQEAKESGWWPEHPSLQAVLGQAT